MLSAVIGNTRLGRGDPRRIKRPARSAEDPRPKDRQTVTTPQMISMSSRRRACWHARMAPMRLPTLRRTRGAEPGTIIGTARLDRRTKRLVGRLRAGDLAVI